MKGETCWRGFFEETRAKRVYSHIEFAQDTHGAKHGTTPTILRHARNYYCAPGAVFNTNRERTPAVLKARETLKEALRNDGKQLLDEQQDEQQLANLFDPEKVQVAIMELARHTSPGADGWTTEYFKIVGQRVEEKDEEDNGTGELVPSPLAHLLAETFRECVESGKMLDQMQESIVSLIYKEKGVRSNLNSTGRSQSAQ